MEFAAALEFVSLLGALEVGLAFAAVLELVGVLGGGVALAATAPLLLLAGRDAEVDRARRLRGRLLQLRHANALTALELSSTADPKRSSDSLLAYVAAERDGGEEPACVRATNAIAAAIARVAASPATGALPNRTARGHWRKRHVGVRWLRLIRWIASLAATVSWPSSVEIRR